MKAALRTEFKGWGEKLCALWDEADGHLRLWHARALPSGHSWEHRQGMTLIGDAAHLMSPFAGEGANQAMLDGALLGAAIARGVAAGGGAALDVEVAAFEAEMSERAGRCAARAAANLDICFRDDAPQGLLDMMSGR